MFWLQASAAPFSAPLQAGGVTPDHGSVAGGLRVSGNLPGFNIGEKVIQTAAGGSHSAAVTDVGKVFTWGSDSEGQLGRGPGAPGLTADQPVDITGNFEHLDADEKIIQTVLGDSHSLALSDAGKLFTWGANGVGQLGNDTFVSLDRPDEMTHHFVNLGQENIIHVAGGNRHSLALSDTGRVFTWGAGSDGQLGTGGFPPAIDTPSEITQQFEGLVGDDIITHIEAGDVHSLAVSRDGKVFTWGSNEHGQLGDGPIASSNVPVPITDRFVELGQGDKIIYVAGGDRHSLAVSEAGQVFAWGYNASGQLGDETTQDRSTPVRITDNFDIGNDKISYVEAGSEYSLARSEDGNMFSWGRNNLGQLGRYEDVNVTQDDSTPGEINLDVSEQILEIAAGKTHALAVTDQGQVFSWGNNASDQLGDTGLDAVVPLPWNITLNFGLLQEITGIHFANTSGSELGEHPDTNRWSVLTPPHAAGTVNVTVFYRAGGQSRTYVFTDGFTFLDDDPTPTPTPTPTPDPIPDPTPDPILPPTPSEEAVFPPLDPGNAGGDSGSLASTGADPIDLVGIAFLMLIILSVGALIRRHSVM